MSTGMPDDSRIASDSAQSNTEPKSSHKRRPQLGTTARLPSCQQLEANGRCLQLVGQDFGSAWE
jgi:hypothetical protein